MVYKDTSTWVWHQIVPVLHPTSDRMFRLALTACILVTVFAAVPNPKTPNQILDAVIERANEKIAGKGWDISKKVSNGETDFALDVSEGDSNSETAEDFKITSAQITGLLLDRSKSAEFSDDESVLSGTLKLTDTRASADYSITFPGKGQVASHTLTGSLVEKADHLFADIEINLDENLVPQSIKSYEVRNGREGLESSSGLDPNWSAVDIAGIRGSLLQILKETLNTNIKVQVNQAIQDLKNEAAA